MRLSKIVTWVFFLAGLTLLLGMVYQVGLTDLLQSIEAMGLWLFPYLLLKAIPLLIHTAGWAACFSVAQPQPSFWHMVLVSRAGGAINQITPTATLGGEMVKVLLLEPMIPRQQGMAAVIIDKATITLSNMLYVTLGALYLTHVLPLSGEIQLGLSMTIGLLFLGLIGFVATQRYGLVSKALLALEWLRIGQGTLQHLRQKLLPLEAHLMAYYTQSPWRFVRSLLLHSIAHACNAMKTYILLRLLLGAQAPTLVQAIMVEAGVAALDQIFFFVPGRIGTLEGARFLVLSTFGVAQVYGLAFGLIARIEQLFWSGIGMIAYAFCTRRAGRSLAYHEASLSS
jgi:glycosyltransferase 2 family protein